MLKTAAEAAAEEHVSVYVMDKHQIHSLIRVRPNFYPTNLRSPEQAFKSTAWEVPAPIPRPKNLTLIV